MLTLTRMEKLGAKAVLKEKLIRFLLGMMNYSYSEISR